MASGRDVARGLHEAGNALGAVLLHLEAAADVRTPANEARAAAEDAFREALRLRAALDALRAGLAGTLPPPAGGGPARERR